MRKICNFINNYFNLKNKKSRIKIELFAGLATFLAMAYILIVNPNSILWNGVADVRWPSVFIATAVGSFIGTVLMAFIAKMPLALAPGMGLNAAVGSMIGGAYGFAFSYGSSMLLIFISGFFFLMLSIIPTKREVNGRKLSMREVLFDDMPQCLKRAIPVGIGLFIALVGLKNANIIISNEFTLIQLVDFNEIANWTNGGVAAQAFVAIFGLIVITILAHYNVRGSVVIGILSATLISIPLKVTDINILLGKVPGITWKFWENFGSFFSMNSNKGGVFLSMLSEGFDFPSGSIMTCIVLILTLGMIDMFDTMGTIVGCASNAGLVDKEGKPLNYNKIMLVDSSSACIGSLFGSSSVTVFVESGAGIAEGGRTGLTALTTALLFLLSIFLLPVFAFIPSSAASSALIYVGVLMMKNIKNVDFSKIRYSVPAFLTIIMMPLCYSITDGIGLGVVTFVIINMITFAIDLIKYKKKKTTEKPKLEISKVLMIVFILFLIYFLAPTII